MVRKLLSSRRARVLVGAAALMASGMVASPGDAALSGSGFQGDDGDQVVAGGTGTLDWESFLPANDTDNQYHLTVVEDDLSGKTDDSLAGGTKDDTECPATTFGGIPNNKDDLKSFALAWEADGEDIFLYLAYIRRLEGTTTASAHGVFELNQGPDKCPDQPGKGGKPDLPSDFYDRETGDLRIAFDDEGGSQPIITVQTWDDACPCWSAKNTLDNNVSEGAFNDVAITDRLHGETVPNKSLPPESFAEMAINMTDAGLIDPTTCRGFGAASLYTGSSGNSDKEQSKDFIAPSTIDLDFCGPLTLTKQDDSGNPLGGAIFKVYEDDGDDDPPVFEPSDGDPAGDDVLIGTCTTDEDGTGDCLFDDLSIGTSYWVFESDAPQGYQVGGTNPQLVTIEDPEGETVTFTNSLQPGQIDVLKEDDGSTPAPLENVTFTLYVDNDEVGAFDFTDTNDNELFDAGEATTETAVLEDGNPVTCTTDATGTCSFLNVDPGFYCVVEDLATVPANYSASSPNWQCDEVEVAEGGHTVAFPFTNPRLHKVVVIVCHQGTNTLAASDVTNGTDQLTTLAEGATLPDGVSEADLCGLNGFGDKPHGNKGLTVDVGSDAPHAVSG